VQRRTQPLRGNDKRLTSGGRPVYLLSGLMFCSECGRAYTLVGRAGYGCAGHHETKRCPNNAYINRVKAEAAILAPVREALLNPQRIEKMAAEMQQLYRARVKALQVKAHEAPKALTDLTARIERLRERLREGDPDLAHPELLAAIERAELKKRELEMKLPQGRDERRIAEFLPRAAELYKRQVAAGLDGDAREAAKARVVLRQMFGRINLKREGKMLFAEYTLKPEALLQVVGLKGGGSAHMEVRICHSSGKNFSSSALAR
jgi:hypothetical protein